MLTAEESTIFTSALIVEQHQHVENEGKMASNEHYQYIWNTLFKW